MEFGRVVITSHRTLIGVILPTLSLAFYLFKILESTDKMSYSFLLMQVTVPVHRHPIVHDGAYRQQVPQRPDRAGHARARQEHQTPVVLCQTMADRREYRT